MNTQIQELVDDFVLKLERHVNARAMEKIGNVATGLPPVEVRPWEMSAEYHRRYVLGKRRKYVRRKPYAPHLCPVPHCKNIAAPRLGMVCAKHKDVPNAKIRKYRKARQARKAA